MHMSPSTPRKLGAHIAGAVLAGALVITALTGCSSPSSPDASGASKELLVWVDATRQPAAEAYAKSNPDEKITIVTVDGSKLESKLSLAARDARNAPDVVFTPNGQAIEFATKFGFSADLTDKVSASVKEGFGATLSACTQDGKLYCLPQDVSTQMLWYNQKLFAQFGYEVPTTWSDYAALAARVATEHPGYVAGSCGDGFCPNVYYRGSDCVGYDLDGKDVSITLATDKNCTRVTEMLTPLVAGKSVATLSPFDPDMATLGAESKVLMLPGFVWYGSVLFKDTFKNQNGEIAAAPLPTWPDGKKGTGAAVGGQWVVNAKTARADAAVKLIEWMTTDDATLAQAATFPAYEPAAASWVKAVVASGFYASDPTDTFLSARSDVSGDLYAPAFNILDPFTNAVAPKLKEGASLDSLVSAWQPAVQQAATDAGYTATIAK